MADPQRFYEKAAAYGKVAKGLDTEEKFSEAYEQYKLAVQSFMAAFKFDKNQHRKNQMNVYAMQYLERAETLNQQISGKKKAVPQPEGGGKKTKESKEQTELDQAIEGAIVKSAPDVKWDDVAGLEQAKAALKEAVIFPQQFAHLFQGKRTPWKGILLYGPPGTGMFPDTPQITQVSRLLPQLSRTPAGAPSSACLHPIS